MRHVFIMGAKSVGQYGGFETFVDELVRRLGPKDEFKIHVACKANGDGCMDESKLPEARNFEFWSDGTVKRFEYCGADVFKLPVPNIGPAVAIWYDVAAMRACLDYCEKNGIRKPIFYLLACRIGPFLAPLKRRLRRLGGVLFVNPDGHEWKRSKWSKPVRKYWKISENLTVRNADLLICDSKGIESYVRDEYAEFSPKTVYVAYGADSSNSTVSDSDPRFVEWLERVGTKPDGYYLVVGRLVPENNFETMIGEFMKSRTKRKLVLVTNENEKLRNALEEKLDFSKDSRIVFAGPEYDGELLKKIRENAYAYLHGHSVGGTNPSLLEALASTKLNLLYSVNFNSEVAGDAALYWTKENGSLSSLVDEVDDMDETTRDEFERSAKARIERAFTWDKIAGRYERLFLGKRKGKERNAEAR